MYRLLPIRETFYFVGQDTAVIAATIALCSIQGPAVLICLGPSRVILQITLTLYKYRNSSLDSSFPLFALRV